MLATEEFSVINGLQVSPTLLKMDIEIHNFPYLQNTSQLALQTNIETSTSNVNLMEDNEKLMGLNTTIGNYSAVFTWIDNVSIDGEIKTTNVWVLPDDFDEENQNNDDFDEENQNYELELYLLYPRGEHILHDPTIGTPLSSLSYAQGIQVMAPQLPILAKFIEVVPHLSIYDLFAGSLIATMLLVSLTGIFRKKVE
jgi:hypothetical protein